MNRAVVDTNIFVRALTGDHPTMSPASRELFRRAGRGDVLLETSEAVVAEVCYVLTSPRTYQLSRMAAAEVLRPLLQLRALRLPNKEVLLSALDRWSTSAQRKFVDCLVVEHALSQSEAVYSYDRALDRVAGLRRLEP
jgi:predicted nucleic acid-binding protein